MRLIALWRSICDDDFRWEKRVWQPHGCTSAIGARKVLYIQEFSHVRVSMRRQSLRRIRSEFTTVKALQFHAKMHDQFLCTMCGIEICSLKDLRMHSKIHAPVRARHVPKSTHMLFKSAATIELRMCNGRTR